MKKILVLSTALILSSAIAPTFTRVQQVSASETTENINFKKNITTSTILEGEKENINIIEENAHRFITTFEQNNQEYSLEENVSDDFSKVNTIVYQHSDGGKVKIGEMVTYDILDKENEELDHKQYIDGNLVEHNVIDVSVQDNPGVVEENVVSSDLNKSNFSVQKSSGVKYEWRSKGVSYGSNRIVRATVASVTTLLNGIAIAASGGSWTVLGGAALVEGAKQYIYDGWKVVYWKKHLWTYHQYNTVVWNMIGSRMNTYFYSDSARKNFVKKVESRNF